MYLTQLTLSWERERKLFAGVSNLCHVMVCKASNHFIPRNNALDDQQAATADGYRSVEQVLEETYMERTDTISIVGLLSIFVSHSLTVGKV